jgi:hypothetical protein
MQMGLSLALTPPVRVSGGVVENKMNNVNFGTY